MVSNLNTVNNLNRKAEKEIDRQRNRGSDIPKDRDTTYRITDRQTEGPERQKERVGKPKSCPVKK